MNNSDDQIVETVDVSAQRRSREEVLVIRGIVLLAAVFALPLYLLILFFFDDQLVHSVESGAGSGAPLHISRLGGMDFSPNDGELIKDEDDLMKNLLLSADISGEASTKSLYLRVGSFETFTRRAMRSDLARSAKAAWPDFALGKVPENVSAPVRQASLLFFDNFEARLPYPPTLQRYAGPLKYCAMADAGIHLDFTIGVGDVYQVEFLDLPRFTIDDQTLKLPDDSPWLSLEGLDQERIKTLAEKILALPQAQTFNSAADSEILRLAAFLEKNGTYDRKFNLQQDCHPVEEFLTGTLRGHCQLFSAGFVALCRARGIPARVGVGFVSDFHKDGKFLVVGGMAHAWPEILTPAGWKILDISPQKNACRPVIDKELKFPADDRLKVNIVEKVRQARSEAGEAEAGPNRVDSVRREKSRRNQDGDFAAGEKPGTLNQGAASLDENFPGKKSSGFKKMFKALLVTLIPALILVMAWFYGEKILLWLLRQLEAGEKETRDDEEKISAAAEQLLADIDAAGQKELTGRDLAEIFARFSAIMALHGNLGRCEHETPAEYFQRLCRHFSRRADEGEKAAALLGAEVYGNHRISATDSRHFCGFLQTLLRLEAVV